MTLRSVVRTAGRALARCNSSTTLLPSKARLLPWSSSPAASRCFSCLHLSVPSADKHALGASVLLCLGRSRQLAWVSTTCASRATSCNIRTAAQSRETQSQTPVAVYTGAAKRTEPPKRDEVLSARSKRSRGVLIFRNGAVLLALVGVGLVLDHNFNARTIQRNLLTFWTGIAIGLDYKFNFDRNSLESINGLHERCAKRLLYVCEQNGGLYVKLGQVIGANSVVLPKPYHALAKLFDDAEHMPLETVRNVIRCELGRYPEEIFESFDPEPIGAASIAQVHRARLPPGPGGEQGVEVAIKVQRPAIPRQAKMDLLCFRILLHLYERIFELPLSFSGQYISDQIEREIHFDLEARNSIKAREAIMENDEKLIRNTCYVPYIFQDYSTKLVMTMEYISNSCKVTDKQKLGEMGLSTKEVARSVMEVFASQIFQSGFVQADGHPANILVRKHPNGKRGQHQVVLIDHGLYVELSENFRRQYAQLWKSIFEGDIKTLDTITRQWGMGEEVSELFASATLLRPWRKPKTTGEQEQLRKKTDLEIQQEMKDKIKNFLVHVELLPKELIFLSRSMRIIQANNQVLGSPVNRLNILAKHAAAALISSRTPTISRVFFPIRQEGKGEEVPRLTARLHEWLTDRAAFLKFRTVLLVLDLAFITSSVSHWLRFFIRRPAQALGLKGPATLDGDEGGGFEDDLEKSMRKMARDEFGVELDKMAFTG
ncbi:ABC1-domain-containing protein [Tilletiaria anomala UBC 951]|uniref:ABC1-domain-containing protein n=1 Tax=Tilletiaria anomala (strain ATCC 24038 / CBS 436.72 / UBC 951) TaxID=1037660 RepID=A0A066WDZ7_TILAU|nr:ABC1-domain-containing protein [Tilletiaria anomala UBC 951]KDN51971.1 ABC1-domain-containing protein [Tilletiaria anomala UBC 951]